MTTPITNLRTWCGTVVDHDTDVDGHNNFFNLTDGASTTTWNGTTVLDTYAGASPEKPVAFIGIFPSGEPHGRTDVILSPMKCVNTFLTPNPGPLIGKYFGWYDDIATLGGPAVAPYVEINPTYLDAVPAISTYVHDTWGDLQTSLSTMTAGSQVMDQLGTSASSRAARTSAVVPLPLPLVADFLGIRRTPVDAARRITQWVVANSLEGQATYLLNWISLALQKTAPNGTGSEYGYVLRARQLASPVGDRAFMNWLQTKLVERIPGVHNASVAGGSTSAQVVTLMNDLIRVQQDMRNDAATARADASRPKSVGDYFGATNTARLMNICNVGSETNLPEFWRDLAAANGKRDRVLLAQAVQQTAALLHQEDLVPVITSDLAKKLSTLQFVGNNINDLADGVNPFLMVVQDYTSPSSEKAYFEALQSANDYDMITSGSSSADLAEIKALRKTTTVQVPTNYMTARLMLQGFMLFLATFLGPNHPLARSLARFVVDFQAKEPFYINQMQLHDSAYGPGRLMRYVQLHTRYYLDSVWKASSPAHGVVAHNFCDALIKMVTGDMSWLPALPTQYTTSPKTPKGRVKQDEDEDKEAKKKATQVRNGKMNPKFEDFRTNINASKFNDVIKKVGAPPSVERNGKQVPMCASYHLRGTCFNNCGRKEDHGEHTTAEDDKLYEWCKKAFA